LSRQDKIVQMAMQKTMTTARRPAALLTLSR
jgi:hypothetical protein